ncbi:hypothetical protein C8R45DRAFT_139929 [Mycena sanguinolenta]|nr:hypothetical protein C8R45DRAFT_139929 [Mycena sanguinolenta]
MRFRLLPLMLLAAAESVFGKGGGKSSSGKSGSSSSESSSEGSTSKGSTSSSKGSTSSSSGSGTHVIIITSGGRTTCYNENNQVIPCPTNSRRNLIIGAVVGGIFGAILLGLLTYFVILRCKDRRRKREKKLIPSMQQEYKPLHDESDEP